jgi:glucosyl-3-phosphoglycerate synthase
MEKQYMKYFSYKDFKLDKLLSLKVKRGLTIGVALPVLNEESTLAKTIKVLRSCGSLIDELIIVDSGSTDKSLDICKTLKVRVVSDKQASRDLKTKLYRGKGWNLWASLFYLNTDIIVWVDSDIQNIERHFITGIIGPLITDQKIQFVKGYYHRPKNDSRVTEIMVRPFINLFFPEMADILQPLSGEYGGKREFLEKLTFYSGYSVEIATLLQAVYGLKSDEVAQSYLDTRIHELQTVARLGRMSASILHTMLDFAVKLRGLKITKEIKPILQQFESKDGIHFSPIRFNIEDKTLNPMVNNKAYAKKFS